MDLPRSVYGPLKTFFYLRNPLEGAVREKLYRNDRIFGRPENAMRCSEMVEVVDIGGSL